MMMNLTESQKKYLRREAHNLKPIVAIGDKGLTPAVLAEVDSALAHHELIKVRVKVGDRDARDTMVDAMAEAAKAILLRRVGNVATLYRQNKKKPKLTLPA